MAVKFPIRLVGNNLGDRHRYFNDVVAKHKHEHFDAIKKVPEESTIDRMFKIAIAIKAYNIDYIIENLKSEDMLYVSCALKATFLLDTEHENIISPAYLEYVLYPEMISTAVNKLKNWIYINLKDERRCEEFFAYYCDKDRKLALKFLPKCSESFIEDQISKIMTDMTPHLLKLLCENSPNAAKIFFSIIKIDKSIATLYDKQAIQYFNSIKCVLKLDSEIYLNILECHFREHQFKRLSPAATKYIMFQRNNRFWQKPELYTSKFLDLKSVAKSLTEEECEKLILVFARSKFLDHWLEYDNLEPFMKRLNVTRRAEFKKRVFVQIDVGDRIDDWPYDTPKYYEPLTDISITIDDNEDYPPAQLHGAFAGSTLNKPRRSGRYMKSGDSTIKVVYPKTDLENLFDEYRFKNFNETFNEFCNNLVSVSSSRNRMHMLLVLISKIGGKMEHLNKLFDILKHSNDSHELRAAVVRSLVKRACVWRLNNDLWQQFLAYGDGLGLEGSEPTKNRLFTYNSRELDCHEGLHSVIIRNILTGAKCSSAVIKSYLSHDRFSTFKEYNLTSAEKKILTNGLQQMLFVIINENTDFSYTAVHFLLDILNTHKVSVDSAVLAAVKSQASNDRYGNLLKKLYDSKIGRKELHSYNFNFHLNWSTTGTAYLNALKHDTTVIQVDKIMEVLKYNQLDNFIRKLSIYFGDSESLGGTLLHGLIKENPKIKYARAIVRLIKDKLIPYILEIDSKAAIDSAMKRFAAQLRANAHVSRPKIDLDTFEWKKSGAKFLNNRVSICKMVDINKNIDKLVDWKRSVKLAVILAKKNNREHEIYPFLVKLRPIVAFKYGLMYFKQRGSQDDTRMWESFTPLITKLESALVTNPHLQLKARRISQIPIDFRPQYIALLYPIVKKMKQIVFCLPPLRHMKVLLPKMSPDIVENVLVNFFNDEFEVPITMTDEYKNGIEGRIYVEIHMDILGKFMLLCKDTNTLHKRYESIVTLFLQKLEPHLREGRNKAQMYLDSFVDIVMYQREDEKYVSCIPIIENIVKWMWDAMPMEKHFSHYVKIKFTSLLNKATENCKKEFPDIYANKTDKSEKAADLIGRALGRYIADDARELALKYFHSTIDLYGKHLRIYLYEYCKVYNIAPGVIKGILLESKGIECRIATYLLFDSIIPNDEIEELKITIKSTMTALNIFNYSN